MTGKRHPFHVVWKAGFDDDGRILALATTLTSDGGWSLDLSEPVMGRALCHVDNAYWIPHFVRPGARREDEQDLADRVPRLRRAAGHVRDRGDARARGARARHRPGVAPRAQPLPSPARRRPTGSPCATPNGCATIWERAPSTTSDFDARRARDRRVQRTSTTT